jgi:hypothetical protein
MPSHDAASVAELTLYNGRNEQKLQWVNVNAADAEKAAKVGPARYC